jgi:hypothetical protein
VANSLQLVGRVTARSCYWLIEGRISCKGRASKLPTEDCQARLVRGLDKVHTWLGCNVRAQKARAQKKAEAATVATTIRYNYCVQLVAVRRDWMRVANLKSRSARQRGGEAGRANECRHFLNIILYT